MVAIRIDQFAGESPRMSKRLLPPNGAQRAANCKLLSGELRGLRSLKVVKNLDYLGFTVRKVYRIPYDADKPTEVDPNDIWMGFSNPDVSVQRGPLVNDAYQRYYWTGDGVPQYNTLLRISEGDPPFYLGVPAPTAAPVVGSSVPGAYARSYVYTFVSDYGEESAPSPPAFVADGNEGATWTISAMETTVPDMAYRNITRKNIYRTVTGTASTEYYFVKSIDVATTNTTDIAPDDEVAFNDPLISSIWALPPTGLDNLVAMPNGFMAGNVGNDIYFSEPYRPHAWPAEYVLSVPFNVVGLAVFSNSLVILTDSSPYLASGVNPTSMSLSKSDAVEPCLSRRSIVSTLAGVYYAGLNGIILFNGTAQNASYPILTKEEWIRNYSPTDIKAATLGMQYIAFYSATHGFQFSPQDTLGLFTRLDRFVNVEGIQTDTYSGEVYLIYNNFVMLWDPVDTEPLFYTWTSKEFVMPQPINFGAAKLKFNASNITIDETVATGYKTFNEARIVKPLNTFNLASINAVRTETIPDWPLPQNKTPVGGSPLYNISGYDNVPGVVRFSVFLRGERVFQTVVTTEDIVRLPSGFKGDVWSFELASNTDVYSLVVAETGKELAGV